MLHMSRVTPKCSYRHHVC